MKDTPSFSVVIETENLGMAGVEDLEACLNSLKAQTHPITDAKEVLLVVGGHVSPEVQRQIAANYPWITIHNTGEHLEYTQAKYRGALVATAEVVVFADSDVRYEQTWLTSLLGGFTANIDADIVAGDTMSEIDSVYAVSVNLTWMFTILPPTIAPHDARYFQFNNLAIRRSVVCSVPTMTHFPFYRGQKIMMWQTQLLNASRAAYRVQGALALHNPPGSLLDWWYRMLIQGRDAVARADYTIDGSDCTESASFLRRVNTVWKYFILRLKKARYNAHNLILRDYRHIVRILLSIPLCVLSIAVTMLGAVISVFNRDYLFRKITEYEKNNDSHA